MNGDGEGEQNERQEWATWKSLRTGSRSDYDSIARDKRGFPIFVRSTNLSKAWRDEAIENGEEKDTSPIQCSDLSESQDIFSGNASNLTRVVPVIEPSLPDDDVGRGKAVASFYSQLPREALSIGETGIFPETTYVNAESPRPLKKSKSSADWFIRKASNQLRHNKREEAKIDELPPFIVTKTSSGNRCNACSAMLSDPLTSVQWESHRLSIAHQLALDGPLEPLASVRTTIASKAASFSNLLT
jgi:hypothetical protein